MAAFTELGVMPEICAGLEELEWLLPTDVQQEAIPMILGGGDVLMAAETGSGKTGAFSIPVIQIVYETKMGTTGGADKQVSDTFNMSVSDRDPGFEVNGLSAKSPDQYRWQGGRSEKGVRSGKHYYETTITDNGLCRIGFATCDAYQELGKDIYGFGFGGTGKKSNGGNFDSYGKAFGKGDVMGCFIDLSENTIAFSKNGRYFDIAFDIPQKLHGEAFYVACTLKNSSLSFNFGDEPFKHTPGYGYQPICKAKADEIVTKNRNQNRKRSGPMAIILEPSRELAEQTNKQVDIFKKHLPKPGLKSCVVIGGVPVKEQIANLERGMDIVTGTPGRLQDLIDTGHLKLENCRFFILDEADGLLKQDQKALILKMYEAMDKLIDGRRLQLIVCSATLHNFDVKKLSQEIMHFPTWVDLKGADVVPETVHHVVCYVNPESDRSWQNSSNGVRTDGVHKNDHLVSMRAEQLSEATKILKAQYFLAAVTALKMHTEQCIVFCRTKLDCDNLEKYLNNLDSLKYSCKCLHGDRRAHERQANLQAFKDMQVTFLICTDVAARGIDVKGVPFVVNYTLPDETPNFIHRMGRVGRAERMGLAISLCSTVKEKVWYHSNCSNRGRGCYNTNLTDHGGCCIWYDEPKSMKDLEEYIDDVLPSVEKDFKIPINQFDGKVTYGERRNARGSTFYQGHASEIAHSVKELYDLETRTQNSFNTLRYNHPLKC